MTATAGILAVIGNTRAPKTLAAPTEDPDDDAASVASDVFLDLDRADSDLFSGLDSVAPESGGDGRPTGNAGGDGSAGGRKRLRSSVLFGFWVPLAPQLAPIVSDLFG